MFVLFLLVLDKTNSLEIRNFQNIKNSLATTEGFVSFLGLPF